MIKLIFNNKLLLGIPKSKQFEFFKESKSKSQPIWKSQLKLISCKLLGTVGYY